MSRQFKNADYLATLDVQVRLGDCLPPGHLARFVVDTIEQLDLTHLYNKYSTRGGSPYSPKILLALLFYAYATGVFSSRKIEQATKETASFRYLAGNYTPDHDTIANFRKQFLPELKELFVQVLLLAREIGLLEIGNVYLDGTKTHADASKSKAVSYKRLLEIEAKLKAEIDELFTLAEQADGALPETMNLPEEISRREVRLKRLEEAKKVLEERAKERYEAEKAEYDEKMRQRAMKEKENGKKPPGRPPSPPNPGPEDGDQYNFTDPDSRIMKNARNDGFDQSYNGQIVVDEESRLIVGCSLSNHTNDKQEALPTLSAVPAELGSISAVAMDTGYFSASNVEKIEERKIESYIATGRDPHNKGWRAYFEEAEEAPPESASVKEKMAYKLRTKLGKAIYRKRKSTVEPVIGIIKEGMGFRQFSLRGLQNVVCEWSLVCLGYNLRRLHVLSCA
jgi:transposase